MGDDTIDSRGLRHAFGAFATGVTVTTARGPDGAPAGFTANSFASVSLEPPLLLVCLARSAASHRLFREAGSFAVNVLAAEQRGLSTTFATRGAEKFRGVAWREEATGAPVLEGSVAWFDCRAERVEEAGDHDILIGRVVAFGEREATPLGYWRGAYVRFGSAEDGAGAPLRVSALIERRRAALLREEAGGGLRLPSAAAFGPAHDPDSLTGRLAAAGVPADLPFVFATYDEEGAHHVVYRGEGPEASEPARGWRFVSFDALPFDRMRKGEAEMLRLYVEERAALGHGRYVGEPGAG